ncbi:MAG TPA: hypothetical protein VF736_14920 [Pyrinomonadaceae bacterium]
MTVSQFLLPGESVLYEAPEEVYYGRTPFALYVTGERLLLYSVTGRLKRGERAVAEPLAGVESVEYSEGGFLSRRGRLDVRFPGHVLALTGSPGTIKEVWRALQQHAPTRGGAPADDEVTIVAPPPPLFDDLHRPPAQVEPLAVATKHTLRRKPSALRQPVAVALVICIASALAVIGLMRLRASRTARKSATPVAETAPASTPLPTPGATPVTLHLMDETFTLEAGSHRAVQFGVPRGPGAARVAGGFRVTWGGTVDFYVMSREQYERFAAGGEPDVTSAVYRQAQWNARVGERLQPGDYCLVFDNRDPEGGAQTVAAEFFLTYDQPAAP